MVLILAGRSPSKIKDCDEIVAVLWLAEAIERASRLLGGMLRTQISNIWGFRMETNFWIPAKILQE
ncbi:MAG: hypothetical protein BA864_00820 [Desulfuromonadales bacterium C00003093]|nr:MAG: hypothetical protein BA864_00820 [Desulfuromonadales bacterium C00003093]